jgi:Fur family transcriptional regulator, ferric uptake regulator
MTMNTSKTRDAVTVPAEIQSRLEKAGLRRTLATRAVIGLFLANPQGLVTHAQVFSSLAARGLEINRVTLYRLLDRLASCGVLRRHADDDARTWRFGLAEMQSQVLLPRFECATCHGQFRLPEASAKAQALAADLFRAVAGLGHEGQRLDLAVHGTCAQCLDPEAAA